MIWWIVLVLVVGSLLALAVVAAPVLRQLRDTGVVVRRLRLQAAEAQRLVPAVTALRHRADLLREELEAVRAKMDRTRSARPPGRSSTKLSDG